MNFIEIAPGTGFAAILFGSSRDDVRDILGEPSEVLQSDAGGESEVWIYDALATAFRFEAGEEMRFVSCETFSKQITLDGEPLVGTDRRQAESLLLRLDAGPPEWLDPDPEGHGPLAVPIAGVTLWFEEGLVQSAGWSVLFDESDEIAWPREKPA